MLIAKDIFVEYGYFNFYSQYSLRTGVRLGGEGLIREELSQNLQKVTMRTDFSQAVEKNLNHDLYLFHNPNTTKHMKKYQQIQNHPLILHISKTCRQQTAFYFIKQINLTDMQEQPIRQLRKSHSVRQRITPTFIHHNIFASDDSCQLNVRYTPTFASTAMDVQGYSERTVHRKGQKKGQGDGSRQVEQCVVQNFSRQKKIAQLNPCCRFVVDGGSRVVQDPKIRVMEEINFIGGRTSHMRKIVELMSNPIFGSGYFWQPNSNRTQFIVDTNPQATRQRQGQAKNLEKLKTDRSNEQEVLQDAGDKKGKADGQKDGGKEAGKNSTKVGRNKGKNVGKSKQDKNLKRYKSAANLGKKTIKL